MQITIHNDRPAHVTRPDPVAAGDGVFGHTDPSELSPAEAARHPATAPAPEVIPDAPPRWTPKALLDRLTRLYARFTLPLSDAGGEDEADS